MHKTFKIAEHAQTKEVNKDVQFMHKTLKIAEHAQTKEVNKDVQTLAEHAQDT